MTESIIYGLHAVEAALKNDQTRIEKLVVCETRTDQRIHPILKLANNKSLPIEYMSSITLNKRYANINHQGLIAVIALKKNYTESDILPLIQASSSPLILILDGITDPHNLGACLRTADATGVTCVITPKDNSASINATVSKVACGAAEFVPCIQVTNLARTLDNLKQAGVWLYGAAGEAPQSLYATPLNYPLAIILGAEGRGLRRLTRDCCDELFSLPMQGRVSSLNVSVTAGVCLYEITRQRMHSAFASNAKPTHQPHAPE